MKIAIFGYPRSGTTMLNHIISQHLVNAGVLEPWALVGEVFNPLEGTRLIQTPDGHLEIITGQPEPTQSRNERLDLFQRDNRNYIIKILAFDTDTPGVVETVQNAGYRIIPIERRDPLSAFLSILIAFRHKAWHTYGDAGKPQYEPFRATQAEMIGLGKSFSLYYHRRDRITSEPVLYYEDIATQSAETTLRQIGIYQEGIQVEDSPTKKMLTFDEKAQLITNLDEVTEHLYGLLTPYMVNIEHSEL